MIFSWLKIIIWLVISSGIVVLLIKYVGRWGDSYSNWAIHQEEKMGFQWAANIFRTKFYRLLPKLIFIFLGILLIAWLFALLVSNATVQL